MTVISHAPPQKHRHSDLFRAGIFLSVSFAAIVILFFLIEAGLKHAPEPIGSRSDLFIEGAKRTLLLTLYAGSLGVGLGIVVGIAKLQQNIFLRGAADFYVWLIRGTPLLVQIMFVYYALPSLLPFLQFNEFTASCMALAANVGAYNAEAIRAGILAVPRGQVEAARSLGLSRYKSMRWVIMPQAFRIVIPPLVNNLVALLKDSSLASAIGLVELTLVANRISSETYQPVPVLTTIAVVYLILTTVLTTLTYFLEKKLKNEAK